MILTDTTAYYPSDTTSFLQDTIKAYGAKQAALKRNLDNQEYVHYDTDSKVIQKVSAEYPHDCLKDGIEGDVLIKVWISPSGKTVFARVLSSTNSLFNTEALRTGMKWRFTPAILAGKPVGVWCAIPFHFRLAQN